jgi:hypothetical protein
MWHRAIVANTWRARINNSLEDTCPCCTVEIVESKFHRFWECPQAQRIWHWVVNIVNRLQVKPSRDVPWKGTSVEQCSFSVEAKSNIKHFNPIWHFPLSITLWTIRVEKDDLVFNQK